MDSKITDIYMNMLDKNNEMKYKSLQQVYGESVSGNVPQRRNLNILGEEVEETSNKDAVKDLVTKLVSIDKSGYLAADDILYLNQYLDARSSVPVIKKYLYSKNITEATLTDKNAIEGIANILQTNGVAGNFVDYIKSPLKFTSMSRSGNLIDIISGDLEQYDIPKSVIVELMQFEGTEGGRGVGQCELGLATLFKDVSDRDDHGDLSLNGEYLEVKGSKARLGGRDVAVAGFEQTKLGQLAVNREFEGSPTKGGLKYNIAETIVNLKRLGTEDGALKDAVDEFVKNNYSDANCGSCPTFSDLKRVRIYLETCYYMNYAIKEKVAHFIFVNTGTSKKVGSEVKTPTANFGQYIIFKAGDIPAYINSRSLSCSTITSLNVYPSVGAPKIGNIPDEQAPSD